jgi:hypothetical protein
MKSSILKSLPGAEWTEEELRNSGVYLVSPGSAIAKKLLDAGLMKGWPFEDLEDDDHPFWETYEEEDTEDDWIEDDPGDDDEDEDEEEDGDELECLDR